MFVKGFGAAWAVTFALFGAGVAFAHEPALSEPQRLRGEVEGEPTRIFVLASPHLSQFKDLDRRELEPLLERLAAFAPSVIAVETLPGETLELLSTYTGDYPDVAASFGGIHRRLGDLARSELELSPSAAQTEARRQLSALGRTPSPPARRRLAATFAAAHDPASALVQWLRLPEGERRAGDGVSAELAHALDRYAGRRDETVLVAAELAARLGLDRLYPADDQTDSDIALARLEKLEAAWPEIKRALDNPDSRAVREATARAGEPGRLLDAYRVLNSSETAAADVRGQWAPQLRLSLPDDLGRRRTIQWETRNLRMAAHVREASADAPGGRVLMIVGSAHKPWMEAYLAQMHDVEIVEAEDVLGPKRR